MIRQHECKFLVLNPYSDSAKKENLIYAELYACNLLAEAKVTLSYKIYCTILRFDSHFVIASKSSYIASAVLFQHQ